MRVLGKGEPPVKGSTVTVTFKGKVRKVDGGLFTVSNELGHEMFFEYGGAQTGVVIKEVVPAPREWVTKAMYCHSVGSNNCYYLRLENGWKAVISGEIFLDGSRWISEEFLQGLKIMEVKK